MNKQYDIILFGVTGFTGKLAAEYLFGKKHGVKWAVSARNSVKAGLILKNLSSNFDTDIPQVFEANLVCETDEQEETLREIVKQTKVVLTCSGPFEKYSQTLVKLCAELGVHYADITGETDFFRQTIERHDKTAQETGAVILCHCGNDCIPSDLTVYEMHMFAKKKGCKLTQVMTYEEFPESASFSGGTAATATFQLGKDRTKPNSRFDPLLTTVNGTKSEFTTINISPKSEVDVPAMIGKKAGPWIMGPIMVNCVRRSNALLGYSKDFRYGDSSVKFQSVSGWLKGTSNTALIGAAIALPSVFSRFLPQPGEGPERSVMEEGFLTLHAHGTMIGGEGEKERKVTSTFQFNKDVAYLYTAALLVETGLLMVEKYGSLAGGVKSPASALGSDLTQRILKKMETSFEIKEVEAVVG